MKLLLEIADDQLARIRSVVGQAEPDGITGFIGQAIEAHLRKYEETSDGESSAADVAGLVEQVRELKEGQRAIAAIVDCSTRLLTKMLQVAD